MAGVPGFFRPRMMPPLLALPGTSEALSLYDTGPLRQTLTSLVDFDLLNEGPVRYSAGAVNVRSEEHTSELQSLMRNSYAVFCLKKKTKSLYTIHNNNRQTKYQS